MHNPYDLIAAQFHESRATFLRPHEQKYLEMVLVDLCLGAHILDLGCGTGRPMAEYLLVKGHQVTGVDRSNRMLDIAQTIIPSARLIHAEMEEVEFNERFDAAIVWDSLFHIDRRHHCAIYAKLRRWLVDGGKLLLSSGGSDHEGFTSIMHGHEFFYSSYSPEDVLRFLEEAGFEILLWEVDELGSRGHVAIVAQAGQKQVDSH